MTAHQHPGIAAGERPFQASPGVRRLCLGMTVAGGLAFTAALAVDPGLAWSGWLLSSFYFTAIALFGVFFIALNYVSRASWPVALRRIFEGMGGYLPLALLSMLVLAAGAGVLYEWAGHHAQGHGGDHHAHLIEHKRPWLNLGFFIARMVAYFVLWIGFWRALVRNSRRQDADGDVSHTHRNARLSAMFMFVFAVTLSLASFDWLMSLDATWFSTIFGVYHFSGLFLGGIAATIILLAFVRRAGYLRSAVNENHYHSLGQWLFAFSVFWAYIWFSQLLLIWYSNIPEETQYYVTRSEGVWWHLSFVVTPLLNFGLPFLLLLPRAAKRSEAMLPRVAAIVLLGRWVDLLVGIFPASRETGDIWGVVALSAVVWVGFAGAFGLMFFRAIRGAPLVPVNDPYLGESIHLHT